MKAPLWLASTALCSSLLGAIFMAPCALAAPQASEASTQDAGEIVVISKRFGSGLTRATTTLGVSDIETRPLGADIMQSLNKVSGVVVSTGDARGGSFSFEMSMRGLNSQQIGLTLDGVPLGDARFNGGSPPQRFIDSSNISRITVSQSAGDIGAPSRFALGGFIDFSTDTPKKTFGGAVEGSFGSYDYKRGFIRLDSGEIAKGLSGYISYSHQKNDIWSGEDSRYSDREHYEAKLRKSFDNGSSLQARVSYNDQIDNDFNIVTLPQFYNNPHSDQATDKVSGIPATDVNFGGALGGKRKDLLAYVNANIVLSSHLSLKLSPYYQTLRGESYRYQDRQRILTGGNPYAVTSYNTNGGAVRPALTTLRNSNALGGPADMRVTPRDRDRYGVTGEFVVSDLWSGHTLRLGGWYERSKSTEERDFYPIVNSATSIAYDRSKLNYVEYAREATLKSTMFYAQDEIKALNDKLTLDIGVTWYDLSYEAKSPLEYKPVLSFSQSSDVNPKLGASYKLDNGVEIYGGAAKNFSGIPEDTFLGSTAAINPSEIEPSTTDNYDLGLRYVKTNFALSAQAFYVKLDNSVGIIPRDSTAGVEVDEIIRGNVATKAANTAGQKTTGFDVTGYYDFGTVDIYGAYTYQDARHDDPAKGTAARTALASLGIIGGARVRDIPEHNFYGEIGWKFGSYSKATLNVHHVADRVGAHIIASTGNTELGVEKIPNYTIAGLTAYHDIPGSRAGNLRIQFNVDNLFDESYIGSVSGSTASQVEFGATIANPTGRTLSRYFVGAPRTYTLSLRSKF